MLKKVALLAVLFLFGFFFNANSSSAATVKIYVDGVKVSTPSINQNGSTLVPAREIAEKIGLKVKWVQSTNTIEFTHPYRSGTIKHNVGTDLVTLSGYKAKKLAIKSKLVNGVTYVPIRLFEAFDSKIHWDGKTSRIDVYSYELRMSQYVAMSNLAYNKLYDFKKGSNVSKILDKIKNGFAKDFSKVQKYLYMYNSDASGKIDYKRFAKEYLLMSDWKLKTYIDEKDFKTSATRRAWEVSGFDGFAFEHVKTGEIVIAYRGTEEYIGDMLIGDLLPLVRNFNTQKIYAFNLFNKVNQKTKPTLVGHSLGGYLAQAVAAYYPKNFDKGYTFNAFGIDSSNSNKNVINFGVEGDIVNKVQASYGRDIVFKYRNSKNLNQKRHNLFNFYSYFFPAKTKYWNVHTVPYAKNNKNEFRW